jgi:hypothetical protein
VTVTDDCLAEKTFEGFLLDFAECDDEFPMAPVFFREFVVYGMPSARVSFDLLKDFFFFEGLLWVVTLGVLTFLGLVGGSLLSNDEVLLDFGGGDVEFPTAPVFLRAFVVYELPSADFSFDLLSDFLFFAGLLGVVTLAVLTFLGLVGGASWLSNDDVLLDFAECDDEFPMAPVFLRAFVVYGLPSAGFSFDLLTTDFLLFEGLLGVVTLAVLTFLGLGGASWLVSNDEVLLDFGGSDDEFPMAPVFLRAFVVYGLPSAGFSFDLLTTDFLLFEGLLWIAAFFVLALVGLGGALLSNDEAPQGSNDEVPKCAVFSPDLLEGKFLLLMRIFFCFEGDLGNPPVFLRPLRASGSEFMVGCSVENKGSMSFLRCSLGGYHHHWRCSVLPLSAIEEESLWSRLSLKQLPGKPG